MRTVGLDELLCSGATFARTAWCPTSGTGSVRSAAGQAARIRAELGPHTSGLTGILVVAAHSVVT